MGHSPLDKFKKIVYNNTTTERKELIKMIWNVFQFFAVHFGKKTKCFSSLFNRAGVSCVNRWNNTEWFIPNDKSFSYGFDPNLQKGIDKK